MKFAALRQPAVGVFFGGGGGGGREGREDELRESESSQIILKK